MKHSKAPYRFEGNKIVCAENYNVATINSHATREGNATGTLLAAAPEMLEALENVLSDLEIGVHPHFYIDQIRFVIAKARGE